MNSIQLIGALKDYDGPPVKLMEVCGSHTGAIAKYGIRSLLSPQIQLVSGPGCPVCVTEAGYIDRLWEIALEDGAVICTFGDMLKVPGTRGSLSECKGQGGKVRVFYAPFDVIEWAKSNPAQQFVVAAVGFETTVPVYSMLLKLIAKEEIRNIKLLTALKRMPPVLTALYEGHQGNLDGLIAPGHVAAVIGEAGFYEVGDILQKPIAITGFGREEILLGIYDLMMQIQSGQAAVHNLYPRVVAKAGNELAKEHIADVFEVCNASWRGFGEVAASGYRIQDQYQQWDAGEYAQCTQPIVGCMCHRIVRGELAPSACTAFGERCTPMNPLGPCMVSLEGACGVWYREGIRK
ncbi:MAG: hydrogenase formation protein HypD [Cellulosilyticaceae bacterium]